MEDEHEYIDVTRYLGDNSDFKFINDPLEDTQALFNYDLDRISRDAMTYDAQRRTAKLPVELQLQIMKASVLYHNPLRRIETVGQVSEMASQFFDGEHIKHVARIVHDKLQEAAEQAFLNNCIFKVRLDTNFGLIISLPGSLLAQIHHVNFHIRLFVQELEDLVSIWDVLKSVLPNLKACVLTLQILTFDKEGTGDREWPFFAEFLDMPAMYDSIWKSALAEILGRFAEKDMATRNFARIMHAQANKIQDSATTYCGHMVEIERSGESGSHGDPQGAKLLDQTYRCDHIDLSREI